jgi:hypothetical protein
MSASHLPENLSEWPDNPYAVLGVQFGIDPRDLRRAYTQLIRSYKPEQFPEHFRRIREAYESVLRHVTFFGTAAASPTGSTESVPTKEEPALERRRPDLTEQMQTQWDLACRGQEADAYSGLRVLYEQHPDCAELCMRLYWLLRLAPEVDSIRKPSEWLVNGLRANESAGPLRELYRRELSEAPERAGDKDGAELLLHTSSSSLVIHLANWRWLAAARLERWGWIIDDVAALRERVSAANPEQWVRLQMLAVDFLAWGSTKAARDQTALYCQEVQKHEELHLRLSSEFDRMEQLQHIATKWRLLDQSGELPGVLADLIPVCWVRPEMDLRPRLDAFLAEVSRQPAMWLESLTKVHRQGAELIDLVMRTLQSQQSSIGGHASLWRDSDEARSAISDFLDSLGHKDKMTIDEFRTSLLDFCLAEAISPEAVASYFAKPTEYWQTAQPPLSQSITADVPLFCVCLAHQMFWA